VNKEPVNTICLCAIVRDESHVIQRMIDSCKRFIDYWVIIDTGSKDNTKEIITKGLDGVPGELLDREWVDFGHNRSELLRVARGKAIYLLLLDADMEIDIHPTFRKENFSHDAYHIRYQGDVDFAQVLFVKSGFDWSYKGYTHEFISAPGTGKTPITEDMSIIHHADGGHRPEKFERDIKLLGKEILENPRAPRPYFYLAQSYMNIKDFDMAIKYYTERVARGGWEEEVYYSMFQIGIAHYSLGNIDMAIGQLMEAYNYRPTRFEAQYTIGMIYRIQKKYNLAVFWLESVTNMPYPKDLLFVHKSYYEYMVQFELGICYYWIGRYRDSFDSCLYVRDHEMHVPDSTLLQNEENLKFAESKLEHGRNDIIFCSMFTVDTPYEQEVQILKKSLDKFGIKHELVGIESRGSWEKNTQVKPFVIKAIMEKYDMDVVWIDADAELLKMPTFFDKVKADISFYRIKEWDEDLTGTMYFKNTKPVREFLIKWGQVNDSNDLPDAKNFQGLIREVDMGLIIKFLPADYIKIFDNDLIVSEDPVIVHNQASRRYKDLIVPEKKDNVVYQKMKSKMNGHTSCAVVGNGPSGYDFSKIIDREDVFVMKCNNFKDYLFHGVKCDLNISSLHEDVIPNGKVSYPIFGILPISTTLYQSYTDAKQMHIHWKQSGDSLMAFGNQVLMYGGLDTFAEVFEIVCKEIKAFPTVGIMAIALARWLGFKKIIVTGFTFFQSKESHYWTDKVTMPSSHHNTEAERKLLKKWVEADEIEYVLDKLTADKLQADARIKSNTAE